MGHQRSHYTKAECREQWYWDKGAPRCHPAGATEKVAAEPLGYVMGFRGCRWGEKCYVDYFQNVPNFVTQAPEGMSKPKFCHPIAGGFIKF